MRLFIFGIMLYSPTYLHIYVGILYGMPVDGSVRSLCRQCLPSHFI